MEKTENEYLTIVELKNYLHIGATNAYRLVKTPGFPATKVCGKFIVSKKKLDQWLEERIEGGQ